MLSPLVYLAREDAETNYYLSLAYQAAAMFARPQRNRSREFKGSLLTRLMPSMVREDSRRYACKSSRDKR